MLTEQQATAPYKFIKLNADTLTPIGIYTNLTGKKKFLLESSFPHAKKGKFSFIGADPYQEFIGSENNTTILHHEHGTKEVQTSPVLSTLKERLPKLDIDLPLPFAGGAIGYIGYDAIRSYEQIGAKLQDDLEMPDVHLMLYKSVIAFDHRNESAYLIAMNPDQESETVLNERLENLKDALTTTPNTDTSPNENMTFYPEMDKEQFMENVKFAKKHIQQGDAFQIVLSQRMAATIHGDPLSFYRKLRKVNPSPYMFYIDFDAYQVLGASPESLVQTTGRHIVTNPIAGTRPRGKTEQEDVELTKDLLADEKEIAEHRMLVDLSRNDIGRVSEVDSITIPTYMKVEKYQHVMHIVSEVHGRLSKNYSSIDALIACLPAGTVSGAPKIRAMQIINDLEESKRGVYAGGIGYINVNHDVNMALAIRSLVIKEKKAYLQAGAGVVYDSDPENEYNETLHKAKSLMEVNNHDSSH
ncbi:anthranilate synthase component I [Virgibacillus phasianinus]|uniref:Anthranilate synthase component 1 n=1 Tax=Virgibacillus phasianinus TaxID=2017483 RepID=A0A220TZI6_9BACI|nr:anthranilate synthase component I [Virgibacillus phasianinus]ASK61454.1 anthranilate synthase component I [Virgibacillus phasianinus]